MIQLTEEQRRALQRIRKRYAAFQAGDNTQEVYYGSDVKTLLALLESDSQAAGAARQLAFAIESAAAKAGILEARQHALTGPQLLMLCDDLANATAIAAAAMRDKCVDELNALLAEYEEEQRERTEDQGHAHRIVRAAILATQRAIARVQSLTLEPLEPEKQK